MPELPEVETTRKGLAPHIEGSKVAQVTVRQASLRWPVPSDLGAKLEGRVIQSIQRRGKYLLFNNTQGTLIGHLGMSGSMRICGPNSEIKKHDHVDIRMANGNILRYHDPRRFGFLLWTEEDPLQHKMLSKLGPEPLSEQFTGTLLHQLSRKRKVPIKNFIMDSSVVVGVGNIYASESLFSAGIRPSRQAGKVSLAAYEQLADIIRRVLARSIEQGGTTLKDFVNSDGQPGYFAQQLNVYGRAGKACPLCQARIKSKIIGQRNSFYCPSCQK